MELEKKRILQYHVEGMIKAYKEAIESYNSDIMTAPSLALENHFKTQAKVYEGKLQTIQEIQKLINI